MSQLNCALLIVMLATAMAQRPSFAGSRPGGLNQKDKYNSVGFESRFGGSENATTPATTTPALAFGEAQQPPRPNSGLPVVQPEAAYTPIEQLDPQVQLNPASGIASRFGEPNSVDTGNATVNSNALDAVANANRTVLPLPIAVAGDPLLIQQYSAYPEDKLPFWLINHLAIEAQRNGGQGSVFGGGQASTRGSFSG